MKSKHIPVFAMSCSYLFALVSLLLWQLFYGLELLKVWFIMGVLAMIFFGFLYVGSER